MSIFGDLDVDNIPDDPFAIASGTYEFVVTSNKEVEYADGTKKAVVIDYSLDGVGKINDFFTIPEVEGRTLEDLSDQELRELGFVRARFNQLGIPANRHGAVEQDDLVGIKGTLEVLRKQTPKGTFSNVMRVSVSD